MQGLNLIKPARQIKLTCVTIVVTAYGTIQTDGSLRSFLSPPAENEPVPIDL